MNREIDEAAGQMNICCQVCHLSLELVLRGREQDQCRTWRKVDQSAFPFSLPAGMDISHVFSVRTEGLMHEVLSLIGTVMIPS
jgi:hypothetical protein